MLYPTQPAQNCSSNVLRGPQGLWVPIKSGIRPTVCRPLTWPLHVVIAGAPVSPDSTHVLSACRKARKFKSRYRWKTQQYRLAWFLLTKTRYSSSNAQRSCWKFGWRLVGWRLPLFQVSAQLDEARKAKEQQVVYFQFDSGDGNWRQADAWSLLLAWRLGWTLLPEDRSDDSVCGRGSNTQPSHWEADTLPLSYCSKVEISALGSCFFFPLQDYAARKFKAVLRTFGKFNYCCERPKVSLHNGNVESLAAFLENKEHEIYKSAVALSPKHCLNCSAQELTDENARIKAFYRAESDVRQSAEADIKNARRETATVTEANKTLKKQLNEVSERCWWRPERNPRKQLSEVLYRWSY